ncbi:hypothetical protein [Vibrio sp. TBV020]|uniref:hypothetical protein n=1 Tax=Vibrio sp. TBV020 TaxID=3137398 RepID=UPI0038CD4172
METLVIIETAWAMPNKNTFEIKPIKEIIGRYLKGESIDPFSNVNRLAKITNDIDPSVGADYCMDAIEFLRTFDDNSIDTVLFDPPYSPRQIKECYASLNKTVNFQTTQSKFWGDLKKEISRITRPGAIVITCAWNSGGVGKKYGFEKIHVTNVAHGGWHNDTIVTVERNVQTNPCNYSKGAYITHKKRTNKSEDDIIKAIEKLTNEGANVTKTAVAKVTGMRREHLSRRYQHLFTVRTS